MSPPIKHDWHLTPSQAIALQKDLAGEVIQHNQLGIVRRVAGIDVGFENGNRITRAAVAVLSYPQLELLDYRIHRTATTFPYIPGLLSFREIPAVLEAMGQLRHTPELVLCDGQGLAHPRRFGIACHLGVVTGLPTVGVAKTRLTGDYIDPPQQRGQWTPLSDKDETIGAVLRTRVGVKPLYISIGHKITLSTAIDYVMACTPRYRLPETTRWAHRLASGTAEEIERALAKQPKGC